jgi:hypothetical protein
MKNYTRSMEYSPTKCGPEVRVSAPAPGRFRKILRSGGADVLEMSPRPRILSVAARRQSAAREVVGPGDGPPKGFQECLGGREVAGAVREEDHSLEALGPQVSLELLRGETRGDEDGLDLVGQLEVRVEGMPCGIRCGEEQLPPDLDAIPDGPEAGEVRALEALPPLCGDLGCPVSAQEAVHEAEGHLGDAREPGGLVASDLDSGDEVDHRVGATVPPV